MAIAFSFFSFFYISFVSWLYFKNKVSKFFFVVLVCVFSCFFSAYFSHDSIGYQSIFNEFLSIGFSDIFHYTVRYELFFLISLKIFSFFPAIFFFCFYAFLSFPIKLVLIERVSRNPILSLLCFFAFFFLYLDGTIIRVSLGIATVYWGVYLLSKNNFLGFFTVILLSALLFHYSLVILLIMPLFRSNISILFIVALTFMFLAFFWGGYGVLDFLLVATQYLDSSFIGISKIVFYIHNSQMSHPYSIFFGSLFVASLAGYFLFRKELSKFELISFNMLFLSFLFLVAFYQSQALQNRFSEIFRYSLVFVAPLFYEALTRCFVSPRWALGIYCVSLSGYFFYYYYFKGVISDKNLGILHTYFSKLF